MPRLLDPEFRYVRSEHTTPGHLKRVFARERKRLEQEEASKKRADAERKAKVKSIR